MARFSLSTPVYEIYMEAFPTTFHTKHPEKFEGGRKYAKYKWLEIQTVRVVGLCLCLDVLYLATFTSRCNEGGVQSS